MGEIEEDPVAQFHYGVDQSLVTGIHGRVQRMHRKIDALMEKEKGAKGDDEAKALGAEIASVKKDKVNAEKRPNRLALLLEGTDKMENSLDERIMIELAKQWSTSEPVMEFGELGKWNHEQFEKEYCETNGQVDLVTAGYSSKDDLEQEGPIDDDDDDDIVINAEVWEEMCKMWRSRKEGEGIGTNAKEEEEDLSASTGTDEEGSKADSDVKQRAIERMLSGSSKDLELKCSINDDGSLIDFERLAEEYAKDLARRIEILDGEISIFEWYPHTGEGETKEKENSKELD